MSARVNSLTETVRRYWNREPNRKQHNRSRGGLSRSARKRLRSCNVELLEQRQLMAVAPWISNIAYDSTAAAIVMSFSEAMTSSQATRLDNYRVETTTGSSLSLESVTLDANGTTAWLKLASTPAAGSVLAVLVRGDRLTDLEGTPIENDLEIMTGAGYFTGSGNGTFATFVQASAGHNVITGDFDNDGFLDVAASGGGTLSILLGNGKGDFAAPINTGISLVLDSMAVGDFNKDGKLDLVYAKNTVGAAVLLGRGDGTFNAEVDYETGGSPYGVSVADYNVDGDLDLAVACFNGGVSVLLGNGSGGFSGRRDYAAGVCPETIATADFNGDGKMDIVVTNINWPRGISVLMNNGGGTFGAPRLYEFGHPTGRLAVGDFNNDGRTDIVAAHNSNQVSVLLNNVASPGNFLTPLTMTVSGMSTNWNDHHNFQVGDINNDGRADLVWTAEGMLYTAIGNGNGTFATPTFLASGLSHVALGNFNPLKQVGMVTVVCNCPPVAVGDAYTLNEDTTLTVSGVGVLANDVGADGIPTSARLISQASNGTVVVDAKGSFTYTPKTNFHGTDSFAYVASDGIMDSNIATVTITVNPVADDLVNFVVPWNGTLYMSSLGGNGSALGWFGLGTSVGNWQMILSNLPNSSWGTEYSAGQVAQGTTLHFEMRTFWWLSETQYCLSYTFSAEGSATVREVYSLNKAGYTLVTDTTSAREVFSDRNNSLGLGGTILRQTGVDTWVLGLDDAASVDDDDDDCLVQLRIVRGANAAPVAVNDQYTVTQDSVLTVGAAGCLTNDVDPDKNPLNARLVTGPSHGVLAMGSDGAFRYTPTEGFAGSDTFQYKVNDGTVDSNIATVSITVTPTTAPPVLAGLKTESLAYTENQSPLNVTSALSVTDPDSTTLSGATVQISGNYSAGQDVLSFVNTGGITGIWNATTGVLTLTGTDTIAKYQEALRLVKYQNTSDNPSAAIRTVSFKVDDGQTDSNVATVTIVVTPVNDPALVTNDQYVTNEDQPLTTAISVLANDRDLDSHALTAKLVSGPAHGSLTFNANGTFSYAPAANYNGTDTFTYVANDGQADSHVATVSIVVTSVNDAPLLDETSLSLSSAKICEGKTIHLGGVFSDGDTGIHTVIIGWGDGTSDAIQLQEGQWRFSDVAHTYGDDPQGPSDQYNIQVTVSDGEGLSDTAWTTVTVANVAPTIDALKPSFVEFGRIVTLPGLAQFADPGFGTEVFTASIDWGDGSTSQIAPRITQGTAGIATVGAIDGSHTYSKMGTYQVAVTVKDDDGGTDTRQVSLLAGSQLGEIGVVELTKLNPSAGDLWYSFTTSHDGPLTVNPNKPDGVQITLYDANWKEVPMKTDKNGTRTVTVTAGQVFFMKVTGTATAVNLHIANNVTKIGSALTAFGSKGNDKFTYVLAANSFVLNGVSYSIDTTQITSLSFLGGEGNDTAVLTGSTSADTVRLTPKSATFTGKGRSVSVIGVANITVNGGGGMDTAVLIDSLGNDTFVASPTWASLSGADFSNRVNGFSNVRCNATSGGIDLATLYDSPGNDSFTAIPASAVLSGKGFLNRVDGFDRVDAFATFGGTDVARLYDSMGDDEFRASPTEATLRGVGFQNRSVGFKDVAAVGGAGGTDRAFLIDSALNDLLDVGSKSARMCNTKLKFANAVESFAQVLVMSSGGADTIRSTVKSTDFLRTQGRWLGTTPTLTKR